MNQTFQIKQIIKDSWKLVKSNIKFFIGLVLISWVIQFLISSLQNISDNTIISIILSLTSWVLGSIVTMGLLSIAIRYVKSGSATYKDGFEKINELGKYLLGSIYYSLIVFVGMLLLVVPGVIWALRYQFYSYLILDKGMSPKDALSRSKEVTKGKIGNLFLLGLVLSGINLLGALLFGLGLFISIPVTLLAMAMVYAKLFGEDLSRSAVQSEKSTQDTWKDYRQSRKV